MSRIFVDFSGFNNMSESCKRVSSNIDTIQIDFKNTVHNLDWDIRFQSDINRNALRISNKLEQYTSTLKTYSKFIEEACAEYSRLDTDNNEKKVIITVKELNIQDYKPDYIEFLKTISFFDQKILDNDTAGLSKDFLEYLENLHKFLCGDKKGLTGAKDWCYLANSSIQVWESIYDFYVGKYSKAITGIFTNEVQKKVKAVSLSGNVLALIGDLFSASKNLDQKKWESIIADYLDSGKSVFSVIESSYALKHLKDANSLINIKAGPWSAMDVYKAITEAGIESGEQLFRSIEKYSSDGKWDFNDTGATGVDVAIAGIHGIGHGFTDGVDELIYTVVDTISGGNGNSDMSYTEKAAEGYKILAKNFANWLANYFKY